MYVMQLTQAQQDAIRSELTLVLRADGLTGQDLADAVQDGMDSRVYDLPLPALIVSEPKYVGSHNGNPQYRINVGHRHYYTEPSAQVGYTVTNYRVGDLVDLTLNHGGSVTHITPRSAN